MESAMDNDGILESNLKNIERGAAGFRILATIFTVFAVVYMIILVIGLVAYGFTMVEGHAEALTVLLGLFQNYFESFIEVALLAWLCRLSSNAFGSIAALTRENRGLV
jgi:hypothetical protein